MADKVLVMIFGGSGDLTFRKLLPALYNLYLAGKIKLEDLKIAAVARRPYTNESYRHEVAEWVRSHSRLRAKDGELDRFLHKIDYYRLDLRDTASYLGLEQQLTAESDDYKRLIYYAVGPELFRAVTEGVISSGLNQPGAHMILEKPFGSDLEDARQLNRVLNQAYGEENVYHIDHYLGKEMVRNILAVRFRNSIFRGIWNRDFIDNIQINALETVGVGNRGDYYDDFGAIRDMVQNHLFQVLSVLALEEPADESPDALHAAQLAVLHALKPIVPERMASDLVLAQYEGYREEDRVAPDSSTSTYAALRLELDTPRWQGIPIYIRTGKQLNIRDTNVVIQFRATDECSPANLLVIKIQPDEGIYLQFNVKQPGAEGTLETVNMDYCQSCNIRNYQNTPEAYERLLDACMKGERSLFSQWDQIEVSWLFADQLLADYQLHGAALQTYPKGSTGPAAADEILKMHGDAWITPTVYPASYGNGTMFPASE